MTNSYPRLRVTNDSGCYTIYIDNSAIATFLQCPRSWHIANVLKRRYNKRSSALGFGAAVHTALEKLNHLTAANQRGLWPAWFDQHGEAVYLKAVERCTFADNDQRTLDNFRKLCKGYYLSFPITPEFIRYGEKQLPIIEAPFEVKLCEIQLRHSVPAFVETPELGYQQVLEAGSTIRFMLIGKIDFATWEGEFAAINDFKTASGKYTTPSEFGTIFQFKGYAYALAQLFGITPAYSKVHQLILTKSGKVEFDIINNTINQNILNDYHTQVTDICHTIIRHAESDTFFGNYNSCHNKFGVCQFKTACEWPDFNTRHQIIHSELYTHNEWDPRSSDDN